MPATYTKYRDVIITNFLGKPGVEEIDELETTLQTPLPDSFKAFLDVANGGEMECYYVDVDHPEMKVPRSFSTLYGTRRRMEASPFGLFDHEIKLSRDAAKLPPQVLPFARDNSGCELYLDLTDEGEDRVVAFIHGMPGLDQQPEDNAWVTLALSFEDYIAQLKVDEDYCTEQLAELQTKPDPERLTLLIDFLDQALPDWREREAFEPYKGLVGTARH